LYYKDICTGHQTAEQLNFRVLTFSQLFSCVLLYFAEAALNFKCKRMTKMRKRS